MREHCGLCQSYCSLKDFRSHRTKRPGRSQQDEAADHISLVLLDLWMPVMDGWEVLRRKKGDPDLANVPVVVISAIPPVDLDGVESVLTKPIDLSQLMETVRHFV